MLLKKKKPKKIAPQTNTMTVQFQSKYLLCSAFNLLQTNQNQNFSRR